MNSGKKAVFLDRDGTINIDYGYINSQDQFQFIPGSLEAMRMLKNAGFLIIIITNQAGIAKGFIKEEDIENLNNKFLDMLKNEGIECDGYYFCPHHHEGIAEKYRKNCSCRKPEPGMIFQAASDHGIDLRKSFLAGDKLSDILAAKNAAVKPLLVMTGYGRSELESKPLECSSAASVAVYDLYDAAGWILK